MKSGTMANPFTTRNLGDFDLDLSPSLLQILCYATSENNIINAVKAVKAKTKYLASVVRKYNPYRVHHQATLYYPKIFDKCISHSL
jgi:hypothetical protein